MQLQEIVVNALRRRGRLDALGLMDYAEGRLFPWRSTPDFHRERKTQWSTLGKEHRELEASILRANPEWTAQCIPDKADQLFSHMSTLPRPLGFNVPWDKVLLVEGQLSREDMRFLECLAKEVHCPVELWYWEPPAASE